MCYVNVRHAIWKPRIPTLCSENIESIWVTAACEHSFLGTMRKISIKMHFFYFVCNHMYMFYGWFICIPKFFSRSLTKCLSITSYFKKMGIKNSYSSTKCIKLSQGNHNSYTSLHLFLYKHFLFVLFVITCSFLLKRPRNVSLYHLGFEPTQP